MDKTPIYGLPYINASDLVSGAPAQFKSMAEGVEKALKEVDDRNNTNGVKPMVATTLANLAKLKGVTGQTGYVTSDTTTANNGPYFWNGSAWLPYATKSMLDQLTQGYESGTVTLQTTQLGAASVRFAKHKTKPKAVLVTRVRNNQDSDDRARIFNPIVWDITATEFQVRFWRLDTHNWAESWPLTFSYLAIW
jgi:hypothetical protein